MGNNKETTVMIGTPTYDGNLSVQFVDSMLNTIMLGAEKNIRVVPFYIAYDALIQRARNDIFQTAQQAEVDYLFFIDSDMSWNPIDFFKLVESGKNIIGAPCIKKSIQEQYNVKIKSGEEKLILENGLIEVESIGTGFLCISKEIINKVWDNSISYKENEQEKKFVFEVITKDNSLISEDVVFCSKCIDLGEKIYINPYVNIHHVGVHIYAGSFINWCNNFDLIRSQEK